MSKIGRAGALLAAAALAGSAHAACTGEKLAEYKRMSPLLGATDASALVVSVHADGCIATRLPAYYRNAGLISWSLPASELKRLDAEITASGVAELDAATLRADVARAKQASSGSTATFYHVTDDDIVQFELRGSAKSSTPVSIRWSGLHNDLLNAPTHPGLLRMSALQLTFLELADEAQVRMTIDREVQP